MWSAWIFEQIRTGKKEINKIASRGGITVGTPTRHLTPFRGIMEQSVLLLSGANYERWLRRPQHSLLTIMKNVSVTGISLQEDMELAAQLMSRKRGDDGASVVQMKCGPHS